MQNELEVVYAHKRMQSQNDVRLARTTPSFLCACVCLCAGVCIYICIHLQGRGDSVWFSTTLLIRAFVFTLRERIFSTFYEPPSTLRFSQGPRAHALLLLPSRCRKVFVEFDASLNFSRMGDFRGEKDEFMRDGVEGKLLNYQFFVLRIFGRMFSL